MHCVIIAGGLPAPDDPLYAYTQGKSKALIDMHGRTMLERVVDALQNSQSIEEIVVAGLGSDQGMTFARPVHHLADQGSLVTNARAGMIWLRQRHPTSSDRILICSADVPAITAEQIDAHIAACQPLDKSIYYIFATKETIEKRFPHSERTYVKLKGREIAGGDLVIADSDLAEGNDELFEKLTNARKHAWQLARIVGLRFLLKLLLRQISFTDIEDAVWRTIGKEAKIMLTPHAELAMDADRPDQIELLRADLARQANLAG